ncbi:MAG: hypothetical protein Q8N51_08110, partial [Gammaproteobacteria bacterium]|nr:hypothetical protein [Gammaproteobacteria bacterium]
HATEGVAALPLAVLIIAAAGAVGIAGILGWQVGQAVSAIGRAVIPLALIAGTVYVLSRFVEAKYTK